MLGHWTDGSGEVAKEMFGSRTPGKGSQADL